MTGEPAGITEGEASRPPLPAAPAHPSAHPLPGLEIIDMAMPLPPLPAALAADKEQGLGLYFSCELCVDFISESKYFHRPGRPGERIPDPRPGLGADFYNSGDTQRSPVAGKGDKAGAYNVGLIRHRTFRYSVLKF